MLDSTSKEKDICESPEVHGEEYHMQNGTAKHLQFGIDFGSFITRLLKKNLC